MNSEPKPTSFSTLLLLALAGGQIAVWFHLSRHPNLETYIPETIGLLLAAGVLYVIAVHMVHRRDPGWPALVIIFAAALGFRFLAFSAEPVLSSDVYRYQWEGRVQRIGVNPFTVHPDALKRQGLEDPAKPLTTGRTTPTLYPPLSEWSFSWVDTISGYKQLYAGLDLASIALLLLLLRVQKLPLVRVVTYAWNPGVVVAFAMCAHHDSLAILALLAAIYFIIRQQGALSIFFLALSFLSKFFSGLLLPVFLGNLRAPVILSPAPSGTKDLGSFSRATRSAGLILLFAAIIAAGFAPYATAGRRLLDGLGQYAAGWENNDSLFRLLLLAGNSRPQAGLVAGLILAGLLVFSLKQRFEPLRAALVLLTALLFLSPNAFPWYFTWVIPFLCFESHPALLLLSATCVLGYAPLVTYWSGGPFADSPLILALEYVPVFAWLGIGVAREAAGAKSSLENVQAMSS